ncbi:MAG: TonB-dependent receptor [Bacteroidales bacterium]|nr:TonB-dependent receptor [Bacteroidales bacterium]
MEAPKVILLLCALLALSPQLRAEPVDTLPDVTVTATVKDKGIIAPQELSGKQLQGLNAHSVADALRYFSGVQIKDYGGVGGVKTIDLRSMGSHHTGVFYDGLQLGNAQNGQIDLGRYSLDNIESIRLYNGQKSSLFQPARDFASGASIYISSREPKFAPDARVGGTLQLRTGSFGLVNPSARIDYKVNEQLSLTASAEYTYANGRYKFRYRKVFSDGTTAWDTTATRRNGDVHALRLEAGAYGRFRTGTYQAKVYFYDSGRGIPGAIVNNVWKNSQRQWDRNFFVQASAKSLSDRKYAWMVSAKYANDYMRYLNPDTTLLYIDNTFRQQELYLTTTHKLRLTSWWEVSLAADWQYNTLDSHMSNFLFPRRHTLLGALATSVAAAGFRAEGSLLLTEAFDSYLRNPQAEGGERTHSHLSRLTPALFLSWKPQMVEDVEVHAFAKRIFRMPTFNDLYYTDIGNATLKPENLMQYDLGASWQVLPASTCITAFALHADGYYNRVTDKIIAVPKGTGQYRWMMTNIGKVKILGLEASGDISITPLSELLLHLRGTYTFQSARDFTDPADCLDAAGTYKGQIAYIPRHSFSVNGDAEWRRWALNYSFIYVGERWDNSSNIPENYVQPWYTHDLSLTYSLPLRSHRASATLEVNNLLNQQYEVIRNYPMPGRNFKLILRFDL